MLGNKSKKIKLTLFLFVIGALIALNFSNDIITVIADTIDNDAVQTQPITEFSKFKPGVISKRGKYKSPDGKAILIVEDNYRIIKLKGTTEEIGYNYGYMLAAEIRNLYFNYIHASLGKAYPMFAENVKKFEFDKDFMTEIESVMKGFNKALPLEQRTFKLNDGESRVFGKTDILIGNLLSDVFCSSFSAWGDARKDKDCIVARNLDYYIDRKSSILESHLITVYMPDKGKKWVNIGFTGFLGSLTAMNEDGVCGFVHNSNKYQTSDKDKYIPRGFLFRNVIETSTNKTTPADIEATFDKNASLTGNNFLAVFKAKVEKEKLKSDDKIAGVLEYDGYKKHKDGRATLRSPSDNKSLPMIENGDHKLECTNAIITTNHYLKRNDFVKYSNSVKRYMNIKKMLSEASEDNDVTVAESLAIMNEVGHDQTLHTTIIEPDKMLLHLYFAEPGKGAFKCKERLFKFADLTKFE